MNVFKIVRERLSVKISLQLVALAIPLMSIAVWRAVTDERSAVQEMLIDRGRVAALSGAAAYGVILESGLDSGAFTEKDLFDPAYIPIPFPEIEAKHKRVERRIHGQPRGPADRGLDPGLLQ